VTLIFVLINISAFFGGLVIGAVTVEYNWVAGFVLLAVVQLVSCVLLIVANKHFPQDSRIKSKASTEVQESTNGGGLIAFAVLLGVAFALAGALDISDFVQDDSLMTWTYAQVAMANCCLLGLGLLWWFKALSAPIIMSVVLQNVNRKYIATKVVLFTLLPTVIGSFVASIFGGV
jgi:hypothetical protein